jgi:hypothetical protein
LINLQRLKEEKFDAVFFDLRMPPSDGIELARQIRASLLNRTTPIVIITGVEDRCVMKPRSRICSAGCTTLRSRSPGQNGVLLKRKAGLSTGSKNQQFANLLPTTLLRNRVGNRTSLHRRQKKSNGG